MAIDPKRLNLRRPAGASSTPASTVVTTSGGAPDNSFMARVNRLRQDPKRFRRDQAYRDGLVPPTVTLPAAGTPGGTPPPATTTTTVRAADNKKSRPTWLIFLFMLAAVCFVGGVIQYIIPNSWNVWAGWKALPVNLDGLPGPSPSSTFTAIFLIVMIVLLWKAAKAKATMNRWAFGLLFMALFLASFPFDAYGVEPGSVPQGQSSQESDENRQAIAEYCASVAESVGASDGADPASCGALVNQGGETAQETMRFFEDCVFQPSPEVRTENNCDARASIVYDKLQAAGIYLPEIGARLNEAEPPA